MDWQIWIGSWVRDMDGCDYGMLSEIEGGRY